jgi:hypothetical protein
VATPTHRPGPGPAPDVLLGHSRGLSETWSWKRGRPGG